MREKVDRIVAAYARTGMRGLHRVTGLFGLKPGDTIRATTSAGTRMHLDPASYIDNLVLSEGYYESEVLTAILEVLEDSGVFWDIGANIGLHAVAASAALPNASVCAFEPSPAILGRLWANVTENKANVSVFGLALSDRQGCAALSIAGPGNPGMTTLEMHPDYAHAYTASSLVATVRGDVLIEEGLAPAPTVIKIDVEGHELSALKGLEAHLASGRCRRVIFEDGRSDSPVKSFLQGLGFSLSLLSRQEESSHNLENFKADLAAR